MKRGTQVGLGPGHIVLDGDQAPLPKKWITAPNFRLVFGTEVGLDAGHIVLDWDLAPHQRSTDAPFSAHVYCGQTVAHLSYC